MMWARLVEFTIVGFNVLATGLAVVVAVQFSIWAGVLLLVLLTFGFMSLIYNYDYWLVRRLTAADAPFSLALCKSGFVGRTRRLLRYLPASPRCRFCLVPFGGFGKLLGIRPSAKNPNYCRSCFEGLPTRTHELEVGVLFADIRGFTSWTETHATGDAAEALTRFYAIANRVLTSDDAFVDFVGDQVLALYVAAMPSLGEHTAGVMLAGARRLVATIREEDNALPVGVGLNIGLAQVGAVAMGESKGFTAVGDVVNTAARLQSCAREHEIVLSESVHAVIAEQVPEAKPTLLELKGKSEPQKAYVIPAAT